MRSIVYKNYKGICVYCLQEVPEDNFHVDHKIHKYSGGQDILENLVLSCPKCNIAKGVRSYEDFTYKLSKCGLVWRDREYRRVRLVYSNRHFLRNPDQIPRERGVSNPK